MFGIKKTKYMQVDNPPEDGGLPSSTTRSPSRKISVSPLFYWASLSAMALLFLTAFGLLFYQDKIRVDGFTKGFATELGKFAAATFPSWNALG